MEPVSLNWKANALSTERPRLFQTHGPAVLMASGINTTSSLDVCDLTTAESVCQLVDEEVSV